MILDCICFERIALVRTCFRLLDFSLFFFGLEDRSCLERDRVDLPFLTGHSRCCKTVLCRRCFATYIFFWDLSEVGLGVSRVLVVKCSCEKSSD